MNDTQKRQVTSLSFTANGFIFFNDALVGFIDDTSESYRARNLLDLEGEGIALLPERYGQDAFYELCIDLEKHGFTVFENF